MDELPTLKELVHEDGVGIHAIQLLLLLWHVLVVVVFGPNRVNQGVFCLCLRSRWGAPEDGDSFGDGRKFVASVCR